MSTIEASRDVLCIDDVDLSGRDVTGLAVYGQDIWHRLNTRQGLAEGYPDDGLDLADYQHQDFTDSAISAIVASCKYQVCLDERTVSARVLSLVNGRELQLTFQLETNEGELVFTAAVGPDRLAVINEGT